MFLTIVECADPSGISRVDFNTLPQQILLEIFVQDLLPKKVFIDKEGNFKDAVDWKGVKLNNEGHVSEIHWHWVGLLGSVDFHAIPRTVTEFELSFNEIQCTFVTASFPGLLTKFAMSTNLVFGTVDLAGLPDGMIDFRLGDNELSGSLDLTKPPRNLDSLFLKENSFFGTVKLTQLPESLYQFDLSVNELSGAVALMGLSEWTR